MPPAAGVVPPQGVRIPAAEQHSPPEEAFAKDAIIAWFRGEFAAANAIIDALCGHLTELEGGAAAAAAADYESAFEAIHRRRLNWIPVIQMQKYYSIGDVAAELKKVAAKKREEVELNAGKIVAETTAFGENGKEKNLESLVVDEDGEVMDDTPPESEITDSGSQEVQPFSDHIDICCNHEECEARRSQFKNTTFVATEAVKGRHMMNVVRGLNLYEDVFTDVELSKLNDFVNELRVAGQNGELTGQTFLLYNKQIKGSKRELIQLGVSIYGHIKDDTTNEFQNGYIEPIPPLLQSVIDHLIQWRLIQENKKPNSCMINFFDEGESSQPFSKPPHLDQPISTLILSESKMAFGHNLKVDGEGNYGGRLMLSLKEGSLLVMKGNSSDKARHVMCSSRNKRVSINFFRVQNNESRMNPLAIATTNVIPQWGLVPSPVVMLAPVHPVVTRPVWDPYGGGTGVFLPWTTFGPQRPRRHLTPRAQRARRGYLGLPSSSPHNNNKAEETSSNYSGVNSPKKGQ